MIRKGKLDSPPAVGAYVLAGGGSSRFGRDKALAELGGQTLLQRMIELMKSVTNQARYVAQRGKYAVQGAKFVDDRWPGEGPLGGIITALEDAAACNEPVEWNLIVSCDMPFLTAAWLGFLVDRASQNDAQVVLAHSASGPEPLCACWRTDSEAALRAGFERGVRKVTDGIALVSAEVLDEKDWKRFDSAGRLFWNMNTAADYEEARRIFEAERK